MSTRRSVSLATAVLGAAFVAWLVTVQRMEGMNGGPGTDLGALGWYVGVWVTMMAAMMLPAVLPGGLLYPRVSSERTRRGGAGGGPPGFPPRLPPRGAGVRGPPPPGRPAAG